jgi:hypothetical protein
MAVGVPPARPSFGRAERELAGPASVVVEWKQNYSICSMRRQ